MIEVIITAKLLDSAENDIIGIKEALVSTIEPWADCTGVQVRTHTEFPVIHEDNALTEDKITVGTALGFLLHQRALSVDEQVNVIRAFFEYNKIIEQTKITAENE